ncbi:MAG: ABC transporter ATP-binding protein, partial [Lachnospiraceae bacterium]|nr:ABC transporter ATP-binding protein [Lachnospiraceae bacterium]
KHMAIPARETRESLFQIYRGTIGIVSHARELLRQVADSLLFFSDDGRVLFYPFGYDHYREHVAGKMGAAGQRTAEEQAMIESLRAVPKKSWLPGELSTESAWRDWRFGLLEEEMEEARRQAEAAAAERQAAVIRHLEEKACQMEGSGASNGEPETALLQLETLRVQETAAVTHWTNACLDWYGEWLSVHGE